ncbi:MAG: MFS transporter [Thermoguttaceae bacterium]|nr:MFS transporter [Thermoguttaceae bacterium]MDW8078362.1 MFS transporter [Thermoguttaceae bacterium]
MISPVSVPQARLQSGTLLSSDPFAGRRYGPRFWVAYVANFLTCIATNTLIRYADFVRELGGSAWELGWIVGIGTVGSLAVRFILGEATDRHGAQKVWVGSLLLFALACFAHLGINDPTGFPIYFWRLVFCSAIAGIFGASTTFISQGAGPARMAELIGMLGTSGFLGVIVGTQLGDQIVVGWRQTRLIFVAGGALALMAAVFALAATAGTATVRSSRRISSWRVLRRFSHYSLIVLGIGMGMGLGLPPVFLPALAHSLGIERVGIFFAVYAPVAVIARVATRGLFGRYDLRYLAVGSMLLLGVAHFSLLFVQSEWSLGLPALIFGVAHAVIYPTVVALGTTRFPERCRGLGTSLMMAASDLGMVVGAPLASSLLAFGSWVGWAPYPTMLVTVSVILCLTATFFGLTGPKPRCRVRRRQLSEVQPIDGAVCPAAQARAMPQPAASLAPEKSTPTPPAGKLRKERPASKPVVAK